MRYGIFLLPLGLLLAAPAQAGILAPDVFAAERYLPPPPGGDRTRLEMLELRDIMARSTAEQRAAATKDAKDETADMFDMALGFEMATLPQTFQLLTLVGDEEEDDTKAAKAYFHRDRPYSTDPSIKTCTPVKPGKVTNSYPSGHSTRTYAMATVLATLMPEKSQALLARAQDYAENRLVCGMHYRSDIAAGQQFGTLLALRLMERPDFQARMTAAKAELRAAGRVP
jgi:acid phosphatase (class A)